jgi:hypothetical protein
MNDQHLSGGSIAALVSYASARYGWSISTDEALTIGAAAFSAGAFIAHIVTGPGVVPAVRRAIYGKRR